MQHQTIATYQTGSAWLIAATSYLSDRIVPDCERIRLPTKEVHGGQLSFGRGPLPAPVRPSGRLARLRAMRHSSEPVALPHGDVLDLRRSTPENWAHFLNNHVPVAFAVCTNLGIDPGDALLILPTDIPGHIRGGATALGLKILTTDASVEGEGIQYDVQPWTGCRAGRAAWVDIPFVKDALARLDATPATAALPKRVFLSRRNTRAPLNEAEVMGWLGLRGFVKVYPEDLSPADQIRLFRQAETMVAVHGAGLAPLLYTQNGGRLTHLVEILHAGHMTDVYRVMAHQVGVDWIGVRGRLKPEYIRPAYETGQAFKAYSLDNFEVDLTALEEAFEMARIT